MVITIMVIKEKGFLKNYFSVSRNKMPPFRFRTIWGWVNNNGIWIFGWAISLTTPAFHAHGRAQITSLLFYCLLHTHLQWQNKRQNKIYYCLPMAPEGICDMYKLLLGGDVGRSVFCSFFCGVKVDLSHFAPNYTAVNLSDGSCRAVLIHHVTLNLFIDTSKVGLTI